MDASRPASGLHQGMLACDLTPEQETVQASGVRTWFNAWR